MHRLLVGAEGDYPWIEVQPGRYRYLVATGPGILVRIVIAEYLAAEVAWDGIRCFLPATGGTHCRPPDPPLSLSLLPWTCTKERLNDSIDSRARPWQPQHNAFANQTANADLLCVTLARLTPR